MESTAGSEKKAVGLLKRMFFIYFVLFSLFYFYFHSLKQGKITALFLLLNILILFLAIYK